MVSASSSSGLWNGSLNVRVGVVPGHAGGLLGGEAGLGLLVRRVGLQRERLLGGEHLHQERQPGPEPLVDVGTEQRVGLLLDRLVQRRAVGEHARRIRVGAHPQFRVRPVGRAGLTQELGDHRARTPRVVTHGVHQGPHRLGGYPGPAASPACRSASCRGRSAPGPGPHTAARTSGAPSRAASAVWSSGIRCDSRSAATRARVVLDLPRGALGVPAEHPRHERGDLRRGLDAAVRGLDRHPRPPGQDVVQVQRALGEHRVHHLGGQVARRPGQRPGERRMRRGPGPARRRCGRRAGAAAARPSPRAGSEPTASCAGRSRTSSHRWAPTSGSMRGARRRHAGQPRDRRVDGVLGHDAVGRVLAAGDQDEARHGHDDGVLAGEPAGLVGLPGQQRAQAGVDAEDLVGGHRPDEHPVDLVEDVVDVGAAGRRVVAVQPPRGVGGADDPALAPRDDEQHARRRPQDQPGLRLAVGRQRRGVDRRARHDQVHALGRAHLQAGRGDPEHRADVVAPDAGRGDDAARPDGERRPVGEVGRPRTPTTGASAPSPSRSRPITRALDSTRAP